MYKFQDTMLDINYLQNYLEIQQCGRPVLNKAPSSNPSEKDNNVGFIYNHPFPSV